MFFLRSMALSGCKKFMLGTDSAPHFRSRKESSDGDAGVFCAPVAMSVYLELFARDPQLDHEALVAFTSKNAEAFYGLSSSGDTVTFEKREETIPDEYDGIVPFRAGEISHWHLKAAEV